MMPKHEINIEPKDLLKDISFRLVFLAILMGKIGKASRSPDVGLPLNLLGWETARPCIVGHLPILFL